MNRKEIIREAKSIADEFCFVHEIENTLWLRSQIVGAIERGEKRGLKRGLGKCGGKK